MFESLLDFFASAACHHSYSKLRNGNPALRGWPATAGVTDEGKRMADETKPTRKGSPPIKVYCLPELSLNRPIIQPESEGATVDESFVVGGPVGDFELLLCHGTVCVVGKMRDLILQLSKSSIYSTKPPSRQVSVMLCQCYNQLTNSD